MTEEVLDTNTAMNLIEQLMVERFSEEFWVVFLANVMQNDCYNRTLREKVEKRINEERILYGILNMALWRDLPIDTTSILGLEEELNMALYEISNKKTIVFKEKGKRI